MATYALAPIPKGDTSVTKAIYAKTKPEASSSPGGSTRPASGQMQPRLLR